MVGKRHQRRVSQDLDKDSGKRQKVTVQESGIKSMRDPARSEVIRSEVNSQGS